MPRKDIDCLPGNAEWICTLDSSAVAGDFASMSRQGVEPAINLTSFTQHPMPSPSSYQAPKNGQTSKNISGETNDVHMTTASQHNGLATACRMYLFAGRELATDGGPPSTASPARSTTVFVHPSICALTFVYLTRALCVCLGWL